MRKLLWKLFGTFSILLLCAGVLGFVLDAIQILPTGALLARLPGWWRHSGRAMLFLGNFVLVAGLLSGAVSLWLRGGPLPMRRVDWSARPPGWEEFRDGVSAALMSLESRVRLWHLALGTCLLAGASIASKSGGIAHPELRTYIPHYLSSRPLLDKLFDFLNTECTPDVYEPRQLSYLVDTIDAQLIGYSFKVGVPHFISVSYYLFWIAICWMLWRFFTAHLRLDRLTAGLLVFLVQTSPVLFFGGTFFRSAKPGMTVCMVGAFCVMYGLLKRGGELSAQRLVAVVGIAVVFWCGALFDLSGAYLIVMAAAHAAVEWVWASVRKAGAAVPRALCIALLCAVAGFLAYNYVVAPAISWHIIGQKPLYSYQYSMIKSLVGAPVTGSVQSVILSADVCRYFLGNLPAPAAVILLISMCIALLTHASKLAAKTSPEEGVLLCRRIATHLAVAATMLLALTFILVSRLPAMLWIDVRRSAYGLPLTVLCCVFAGFVISAVYASRHSRYAVQAALLVLLAGNIASLPEHGQILGTGHLAFTVPRSIAIRDAFRAHPAGAAEIPEEVRRDPVYKALDTFVNSR